jgi:hypothetical protein
MSWDRREPPGGGRRNPVKRNGLGHLPEVWFNSFRTHLFLDGHVKNNSGVCGTEVRSKALMFFNACAQKG